MITTFFKENGTLLTLLFLGGMLMVFLGVGFIKQLISVQELMQYAMPLVLGGGAIKLVHSQSRQLAESTPPTKPLVGPHGQ